MSLYKRLLALTLALLAGNSFGQSTSQTSTIAPKYSNEFLAIGVGARGLGMSNSIIASVNDVTAGYWNPAGLLNISNDAQLGLMHAEYFAGIAKFDYGAFAKPLDDKSAIGISIMRFGVDDIPNTTQLIDNQGRIDYDKITSFTAADYAFIVSYARKTNIEGLSAGGNVKIVHRKIGDFANSWGFGLDASALYTKKEWVFGAMFRDVTTTFNAWSFNLNDDMREVFVLTGNEIPTNSLELTLPKLILAATRNYPIGERFSIQPELNLDLTFDGKRNVLLKTNLVSVDPHAGFEFGFKNLVFVRAGIGNIQRVTELGGEEKTSLQPNMGLGIKIKQFSIDYALSNITQSVGTFSNIFSLRFDIDKPDK